MIYNSLSNQQDADATHDPEIQSLDDIVSTDITTDITTGIRHENLRHERHEDSSYNSSYGSGHESGHESGYESSNESDPVSDIGTNREKLREIRDWHLSKAQMSWSLETQERHQQFVTWLEEAIQALDNKPQ